MPSVCVRVYVRVCACVGCLPWQLKWSVDALSVCVGCVVQWGDKCSYHMHIMLYKRVGEAENGDHIMSGCSASVSLRIHQKERERHERLTTAQPRRIQFSINAPPFTHPLRAHDDDDGDAAASYHTFTLFACKSICHIASWAAAHCIVGFQIHA